LIYFANPYPGTGKLLWSGTAGSDGRIDVTSASGGANQPNTSLPFTSDPNRIAVPGVDRKLVPDFYPAGMTEGAKIWVVPAESYDNPTQKLVAWNDTVTAKMFFETGLIKYTYTTAPSDESIGLITTIIEPTVGISVNRTTIDFGSVMIGKTSTETDLRNITITNIGNVDANVATLVSDGFYKDCLWLKGPADGDYVLAENWTYTAPLTVSPNAGCSIVVKAQVRPTAAYATASITGTIIFIATMH
jgi:hypothetical protein